jgi:hypothetical protein
MQFLADFIIGFITGWIFNHWRINANSKCKHKWKTVKETNVVFKGSFVGFEFIQACEHCGEIKKVNTTDL